jgi:hypothetical protein
MNNQTGQERLTKNQNEPRISKWFSNSANLICLVAVTVWAGGHLDAQVGPGNSQPNNTPPANPLTDPLSQTQTRALPNLQGPATQQPAKQIQRPDNPNAKPKIEIPPPEDMILDTTDGVRLKCTYFAPPKSEGNEDKVVLPFILLHEWDGDRRQMLGYAAFLQSAGHAAIVPDLRGHGESTQVVGLNKPLDYTKFRKTEVMTAMKDIERCKKFLVQQHNKHEVNVDLLCVVAVGQTSVLAVQWTLNDWFAFPPRNPQGVKQGQDVKALMLVSPVKKLAGISMVPMLNHPMFSGANGLGLPTLVFWNANEDSAKDSEAIADLMEKNRPDVSSIDDLAKRIEMTTFFKVPITKHKYSGLEMIEQPKVENFWPYISNLLFEQKVVANAKKFPWESREPKKEEDDE